MSTSITPKFLIPEGKEDEGWLRCKNAGVVRFKLNDTTTLQSKRFWELCTGQFGDILWYKESKLYPQGRSHVIGGAPEGKQNASVLSTGGTVKLDKTISPVMHPPGTIGLRIANNDQGEQYYTSQFIIVCEECALVLLPVAMIQPDARDLTITTIPSKPRDLATILRQLTISDDKVIDCGACAPIVDLSSMQRYLLPFTIVKTDKNEQFLHTYKSKEEQQAAVRLGSQESE